MPIVCAAISAARPSCRHLRWVAAPYAAVQPAIALALRLIALVPTCLTASLTLCLLTVSALSSSLKATILTGLLLQREAAVGTVRTALPQWLLSSMFAVHQEVHVTGNLGVLFVSVVLCVYHDNQAQTGRSRVTTFAQSAAYIQERSLQFRLSLTHDELTDPPRTSRKALRIAKKYITDLILRNTVAIPGAVGLLTQPEYYSRNGSTTSAVQSKSAKVP